MHYINLTQVAFSLNKQMLELLKDFTPYSWKFHNHVTIASLPELWHMVKQNTSQQPSLDRTRSSQLL